MKKIFLVLVTSIATLLFGSSIALAANSYTYEKVNIAITGDNNSNLKIPLYVLKTNPSNIGLKSLVANNNCGNLFTRGNTSLLGINGGYWATKNENSVPKYYLYNIAVMNGKSIMPSSYGGNGNTGLAQKTIVFDSTTNKVFMKDYYNSTEITKDVKSNKWWAQSSNYVLHLENESNWKNTYKKIPSYNKRVNYDQEIRRGCMIYGKQGNEYKIWLIGTDIGCTVDEFRKAILKYEQSKTNWGVDFKDGIVLDGAYVSQMRIDKKIFYPTDSSTARLTPEVIYLINTN